MGLNAQRRKEAKDARRTLSTAGTPAASVRSLDDAGTLSALTTAGGFSRLARRTCDECGGSDLVWSYLAGLRAAVSEDQRARVDEIAGFVGAGAEAWRCVTCGNFGVLGGLEASDGR